MARRYFHVQDTPRSYSCRISPTRGVELRQDFNVICDNVEKVCLPFGTCLFFPANTILFPLVIKGILTFGTCSIFPANTILFPLLMNRNKSYYVSLFATTRCKIRLCIYLNITRVETEK